MVLESRHGAKREIDARFKKAPEEGIDLSQLYERLSWTPTERLKRNYRAAAAFEELRKAGRGTVAATDVEKILTALHDQGVDFVIIGGAAAVLHGPAYVTADLDICHSRHPQV